MKTKLIEHLLSILLVTVVLCAFMALPDSTQREVRDDTKAQQGDLGDISFVRLNDRFQQALLSDVVNIFYPGRSDHNAALINDELLRRERQFSHRLQTSYLTEKLTGRKLAEIAGMYVKFLMVYAVVMLLTYYGVQTLGTWLFVARRRPKRKGARITRFVIRLAGFAVTMVLFSPAYVIAYSMRTELNTDTVLFMAILAVVSNGLLIVYATRFLAFLEAESRKGYVETALVKNLHASWGSGRGGIGLRAILRPRKRFGGHVFDHIFSNARFQYLSTVKEQAAFLITGLIIIEMALNIHGHLCYEMLRQMMYGNYDIVVAILLAIFYTVKLTEVVTDVAVHRQTLKYENR